MKAYIPETLYLLAQARREAGRGDDALVCLNEALDVADSIGSHCMAWRILAALADLSSGAEADQLRVKARAIIDLIENSISSPVLRHSFHNRPDVHDLAHI